MAQNQMQEEVKDEPKKPQKDKENIYINNEEIEKKDDETLYVWPFEYRELKSLDFYRAIIAEFFATLFFVGFSILSILSTAANFPNDLAAVHIWIVLYHIVLILLVIYSFSALSGAHFNPAITLASLFTRRVTLIRAITYVAAQLTGAIAGSAMVKASVPPYLRGNLSTPQLSPGVSAGEGIAMEFFLTFSFVFGVFATAFDPRGWGKLGPFAIAFIIGLNIHAGEFVTGGIMNPARAFGPAVVSGTWNDQYIYWVGDLVGGVGGACVYQYLFMYRERARASVPSTGGDNHNFIHYRNQHFFIEKESAPVVPPE